MYVNESWAALVATRQKYESFTSVTVTHIQRLLRMVTDRCLSHCHWQFDRPLGNFPKPFTTISN